MASMDLSPEQVASAREQWVALGKDGAQFDGALGIKPADAPDKPAVTIDRTSGTLAGEHLTDDQLIAMSEDMIAHGADPATVRAALAKDGVELVEDERDDDAKDWDADHGFDATHDASEYRIDPHNMGIYDMPAPSQVTWINDAKQFAADLNLDPGLGTSLMEDLARTAFAYDRMSPAEQAAWGQAQSAALARLVGDADVNKEVGHALSFATNKDFAAKVAAAPLSAFFKASLVNHSRAISAWRAGLK